MSGETRSPRRLGTGTMVAVSVAAFGFTFALIPLYRIACEKVFGIRLERSAASGDALASTRGDRLVTVTFDGGVSSKLPWEFAPRQMSMQVRPGELYETTYFARNTSDRAIVGSATPSVARYVTTSASLWGAGIGLKPPRGRDSCAGSPPETPCRAPGGS